MKLQPPVVTAQASARLVVIGRSHPKPFPSLQVFKMMGGPELSVEQKPVGASCHRDRRGIEKRDEQQSRNSQDSQVFF